MVMHCNIMTINGIHILGHK